MAPCPNKSTVYSLPSETKHRRCSVGTISPWDMLYNVFVPVATSIVCLVQNVSDKEVLDIVLLFEDDHG